MRIGCSEACACVSLCYESAKHGLAVTVLKIDEMRSDPEVFQKAFLVALSIIRGLNYHCGTHFIPHLINVLDQAPTFDFYGFCRLPRYFLHPYTPDRMDEYAILDRLEVTLCDNWHLGLPDTEGDNRDPTVRQFAKEQLTSFLERMVETDHDFRTEQEVRDRLQRWIECSLEIYPEDDFDPHNINLQDLPIPLKKTPLLEAMTLGVFVTVDIACVPDFLQGWSLVDLSPLAKDIGLFPLLSWVPNQSLEEWIWGGMIVGFCLLFCHSAYSLWEGELTPEEANNAKWSMAVSFAESLYCLSILFKKDPKLINGLAFIAKSLGVIAFFMESDPTFFNDG